MLDIENGRSIASATFVYMAEGSAVAVIVLKPPATNPSQEYRPRINRMVPFSCGDAARTLVTSSEVRPAA